jgi:hypothetical protein
VTPLTLAFSVQKLVEFVLGCAVQCEDKPIYIQKIMVLDKQSQQDMMILTQRALERGEENALDRYAHGHDWCLDLDQFYMKRNMHACGCHVC